METESGIRNLSRPCPGVPGRGSRRWTCAGLRALAEPKRTSIRVVVRGSWLELALLLVIAAASFAATRAVAAPILAIDARTGGVLYESQATVPWYPASLTKLMTVYVALEAVRAHHVSLDTPLAISARAASMPPSKMGFRPGTLVTLDNALKMLMVKSANDIAVAIAEGVSGSVEAFAEDMNDAASRLGLVQSHFVNPNGLPDPRHVSSARDLALLAQALYAAFPEYAELFSIGALRLGDDIIKNHNHLLGRYPGADGMKTGFTCPAGFNLVASATRDGRRVIAVVLGAPNVELRTLRTAILFDRAFAGIDRPTVSVATLPSAGVAAPPDMRAAICRKPAAAIAAFAAENQRLSAPLFGSLSTDRGQPFAATSLAAGAPMVSRITLVPQLAYDPLPVFVGPSEGYSGLVARARPSHSPIGTEGPPETAQAYRAEPRSPLETEGSPVAPDHAALPLKGHRKPLRPAAARKTPAHHHVAAHAPKGGGHTKAVPKPPAKAKRH